MKKEQILDMIGEAPERYVKDAREPRVKHRIPRWTRWMGGVAAVLAAAVLVNGVPGIPLTVSAQAVSVASEPRKTERPKSGSDEVQLEKWRTENEARGAVLKTAREPVAGFAGSVSGSVLSGTDDTNRVWSPVNAYIALAMTAELTGSDTQAELLDVLGASGTEELRSRVSAVWEEIYADNGKEISVLANSLWLDRDVEYVKEKMDSVAYDYYASVFKGELGSEKTNKAMTNWMRNQTGGLLGGRNVKMRLEPENQVLAIASTVYFQSQWTDEFDASDSTPGLFHAASGDRETTFMNKKEGKMTYWRGESFGAVRLHLENGSEMWFILPDEGKTADDVLAGDEYMKMITHDDDAADDAYCGEWMKVNLSVPAFDVSASTDLKEALREAGVTGIFELYGNDFTPSVTKADENGDPVYLSSIDQETRVKIDEKGVAAASYIELDFRAGNAAPPEKIVDFVLDRPFVFAVTKSGIPLFMGTVNMP